MHQPALTTGALARRLGIAPTTLRTWDLRYGIGPTTRPDGTHRRWTPDDVAVVERMCHLTSTGAPPAEAARVAIEERIAEARAPQVSVGSRHADTEPNLALGNLRRGLARAALRLDSPALERQLATAVETYGTTDAWEHVIAPVLHSVGRKWASAGERYVEVEHLLSWHVSTALRRHIRPAPGPDPVVLACMPGEQHTLALEALHAALAEQGLPVRMFGAALPVPALTAAVHRLGPPVVVLWAQTRSTANPAVPRRLARTRWGVQGARRGPSVILAGPGWLGRAGEGMPWPGGLREAVDVVSRGRGPA